MKAKVAILEVHPVILKQAMKMPESYEILGIVKDPVHGTYHISITSEDFPEVQEGYMTPRLLMIGHYEVDENGKPEVKVSYEVQK